MCVEYRGASKILRNTLANNLLCKCVSGVEMLKYSNEHFNKKVSFELQMKQLLENIIQHLQIGAE